MTPSRILTYSTYRFAFAVFFPAWVFFAFIVCTLKQRVIPAGEIPKINALVPGAAEYGKPLFEDLWADNQLDSQNERYDQLVKVFDHLIQVAQPIIFPGSPALQIHSTSKSIHPSEGS